MRGRLAENPAVKQHVFQDKRYRDKETQVSVAIKEAPAQCTVQTADSTTQHAKLQYTDSSSQASRVTHNIATQHYPTTRDMSTYADTELVMSHKDEMIDLSDDSAIEVEDETCDTGIQHSPDTKSAYIQSVVDTDDMSIQVELSDDKLEILIEELKTAQEKTQSIEQMLSFFYVPVQYSEVNDHIDYFKNYLNNLITDNNTQESRSIALHPTSPEKERVHTVSESYMTAANNSPADLRRSDTIGREEEELFSSFENSYNSESGGSLQDELRLKLDLAYKVFSRRSFKHS